MHRLFYQTVVITIMVFISIPALSMTESEEFELYKEFKSKKSPKKVTTAIQPAPKPKKDKMKPFSLSARFGYMPNMHQEGTSGQLPQNNEKIFKVGRQMALDADFKLSNYMTFGLGVAMQERSTGQKEEKSFQSNMNNIKDFSIKSLLFSGHLTVYPFYKSSFISPYLGIKGNYNQSSFDDFGGNNMNQTNKKFTNRMIKPFFAPEPFLGFLLVLNDYFMIDLRVSYQMNKYVLFEEIQTHVPNQNPNPPSHGGHMPNCWYDHYQNKQVCSNSGGGGGYQASTTNPQPEERTKHAVGQT